MKKILFLMTCFCLVGANHGFSVEEKTVEVKYPEMTETHVQDSMKHEKDTMDMNKDQTKEIKIEVKETPAPEVDLSE